MREQIDSNNVRWFMSETKVDTRSDEQKLAEAAERFRNGGQERQMDDLVECCARAGYEAMASYLAYSLKNNTRISVEEQPEDQREKFRFWVDQIMDGVWSVKDAQDLHALVATRLFGQVVRSVLVAHGRLGLAEPEKVEGSAIAQMAVARNFRMNKLPQDALITEE